MNLQDILNSFVDAHYDEQKPLLLALSGGPDSLCLFHLLRTYQGAKKLRFGMAHVDHGWRTESRQEALQLEQLANRYNIPFHLKVLNPKLLTGNLEEACRMERLKFYSELCMLPNAYQAVVLGHQADDQSETVLKKIFEGSSVPYLAGMAAVSTNHGVSLWRPFLDVPKKEIIQWIEDQGYKPFIDKTNLDTKFLRGRFRTSIIPELSKEFGKEVGLSLRRIGSEAQELKDYLNYHLNPYLAAVIKGPFGLHIDLSNTCPSFDLELRYLIRKICESENIRLSYHLLNEACRLIREKTPNAELANHSSRLYIDRGRLFIMNKALPEFSHEIILKNGLQVQGPWNISVDEDFKGQQISSHWKQVWEGKFQVAVPKGEYCLARSDASLSKWWTNEKVPAFMRWGFPVIWKQDSIVHEFLTGRKRPFETGGGAGQMLIEIQYKP
jgi:tRNA(Ile)-lysidine synthase